MKPIMTIDRVGTKHWKLNGEYHCIDGAAVKFIEGWELYFLEGLPISKQEWLNKVLFNEVKISSI